MFNRQDYLRFNQDEQDESIRQLHSYDVLSYAAIAAIVGCPQSRVRKILGPDAHHARGSLNPVHIPWLGYALSTRKIAPGVLRKMIKHGTSINMIAALTGISKATLHRWRNQ